MDHLLILASYRSRKGQCVTATDVASACARAGLRTVLIDLTPRPPRSRQRGRAGKCSLASILVALTDGAADLGRMTCSTRVPGLSLLAARPSPADDTDDPDVVAGLLTALLGRLLSDHDRVVVASPPVLDGLGAAMLLVVPSTTGRCDIISDIVNPLRGIGLRPDNEIADTPDLLVTTLAPDVAARHIPDKAVPRSAVPDDDDVPTPTTEDAEAVVPRCYYLSAGAIGSLRVFSKTLSDRLGRHIKISELVAVAIRTSLVLDHTDQLGRSVPGHARTYYLRPSTLMHLTQLALLSSRATGHHVRLSDVVDCAIRLFCSRPPEEQVQLLEANRRKREHRA